VVVVFVRPETRHVVRQDPPEKILRPIIELSEAAAQALDKRA